MHTNGLNNQNIKFRYSDCVWCTWPQLDKRMRQTETETETESVFVVMISYFAVTLQLL